MVLGSKLPGGLSLLEGKMLQIMSVGYCNLDFVRPSPTPFRLNENRKLIKKEHLQIITKQIYAKLGLHSCLTVAAGGILYWLRTP